MLSVSNTSSRQVNHPMQASHRVAPHTSQWYVRVPFVPVPSQHGEPCNHRASGLARQLRAVNNQHSHLDDELIRMQSQLLVQAPQTSNTWEAHRRANGHTKHHVFHDTDLHPYQRQPQRHVHYEGQVASDGVENQARDLASAVELSYQYSSNIVNYHTEAASMAKAVVHWARVLDYNHPAMLARDLILSLLGGGKLLLELPDEPAAVSSLMTALGQAASKLRDVGLATALDPVYDPGAVVHGCGSTCHGNGSSAHTHSTSGHQNHHHHHGTSGGGGGGSPSSSYDSPSSGGAATRRSHDSGGSVYVFCARAVPMPPAADTSADGTTTAATYTVGSSMGQEVLSVGPSVGVHTLLPALLRAILRDGLVTLRCCWFDEELGTDFLWPDQMNGVAASGATGGVNGGAALGSTASENDQEDCEEPEGCDATSLWSISNSNGNSSAGTSGSAGVGAVPGTADTQAARFAAAAAAATAGSLVRVPCVLRAIFKLDRQLRGLDLGGLVVLPHTFARSCRDSRTQVLHLDVVIA